jgi:hypothetical protein
MTSDDENIAASPEPEPEPVAAPTDPNDSTVPLTALTPEPAAVGVEPAAPLEPEPAAVAAATVAPEPAATAPQGRVGWRRFAAILLPSTAIAVGLVTLTAQGVLAASFSISGLAFTVTSPKLLGTGFEQYGALDSMAPGSPNAGSTGGSVLVAVSAIHSAKLMGLCQSVSLGGINLVIRAGSASRPVTATDLVVDSSVLSGDATFNTIAIGQDASTLDTVPGINGPIGDFGQQSQSVEIDNLRQINYATTAATFKLPGLSLSFSGSGC